MTPDEAAADVPQLRVVRGHPTDDELAALTAVLTARAASAESTRADVPPPRSRWSRGAGVRRPLPPPGPGAWRFSGRPG